MIKESKKVLKLIRHAYGIKSSIVLGIAIFAAGVLSSFYLPAGLRNQWVGSYLILAMPMWSVQMLYSLSASNMVQASAERKMLQTTAPVAANTIGNLLMYGIILLIKSMQVRNGMYTTDAVVFELLLDSGLMIMLSLYNGIAYKMYYASTVVFFLVMLVYGGLAGIGSYISVQLGIPLAAAVGIGFLAIAAGTVIQYAVSLLAYRRHLDKYSQMTSLRKAM